MGKERERERESVPQMKEIKNTIGIDANRATDGGVVGAVTHGVLQAGPLRGFHQLLVLLLFGIEGLDVQFGSAATGLLNITAGDGGLGGFTGIFLVAIHMVVAGGALAGALVSGGTGGGGDVDGRVHVVLGGGGGVHVGRVIAILTGGIPRGRL